VAIVVRAVRAKALKGVQNNGRHQPDPDPAPLPPPPQDLPVLRRQRAQDRLQGRSPFAALHFERGKIVPSRITAVSQKKRELAKAINGPLPRPAALRGSLKLVASSGRFAARFLHGDGAAGSL
jgi:hypothetical protein